MFTGIVEEAGRVERITQTRKSIELVVRTAVCGRGLKVGASLAVNGCCRTAVQARARGRHKLVQFDLLRETWIRTNLQFARIGSLVNLERSLPADGRLGGHFVTGHIDDLGEVTRWEPVGESWRLEVRVPAELARYLARKGSITVNGVSLTVNRVEGDRFEVNLIPHTLEVTNLKSLRVGAQVNLEVDLLARYIERLFQA